jgi:hypothetical protein
VDLEFVVGYANYEKVVAYWHCSREKFLERGIRLLTAEEKSEKRKKKEEECVTTRPGKYRTIA